MIEAPIENRDIRTHYDTLSRFYKTFWGNHIHHGYWEGTQSDLVAQVRLIEELVSFAGIERQTRILDVGSGIGGSSVWLAERLGCTVLGLTISRAQVEMSSRLAAKAGVGDRVAFWVHDANRLDDIESGFDFVWAVESSEHLQDKRGFFQAVGRCLKPGGTLALCAWLVPDSFSTVGHRQLATQVCEGMLCPSLASMREYLAWIEAAGFHAIQTRDITRKVEPTWDHCLRIIRRPEIQLALRTMGNQTRQFVDTFDTMRRAYAEGALRYAMVTGRSAYGSEE